MTTPDPAATGASSGERAGGRETAADAAELSLARFRAPRYWPIWLLVAAMKLTAHLPYAVQRVLGRLLGAVLRVVSRRRRRIAAINLRACFPELSDNERARLLRRHFDAVGMSFVELGIAWFMPRERLRRLVRIEGIEHIERAQREGRGILAVGAHFTPLEIGLAALEGIGPGLTGMYRSQRNEMMDVLVRRGRTRYTDEQFPRDDVRGLLRSLKRGKIVVYLPDQTYVGNQSALLPFLGEPAMTNIAMTKLARLGRATVLPYLTRRLPGTAGYEVTIGPPLEGVPSEDPIRDTRVWLDVLEARIRTAPEQYLWIYKKFKGRPPPLPDLYRSV